MEDKQIFEKRWLLATSEQREKYHALIASYLSIEWTFKEKSYLLWLCQLDNDTFKSFEAIFAKLINAN
ncbi:hypothetical protein I6I78_04770 [Enterococcus casseliflavus]|uniref:hypothetical protein n=1 Tax=Enterococcus casseliflavus TaxID=37734 RepID=UPI001918BBDB|nr:hypothetical protein [Enterococcus casseliflavus]QQU20653.1 hypothetical protein I6I78_04770 [Enterococcus casseliflavus]